MAEQRGRRKTNEEETKQTEERKAEEKKAQEEEAAAKQEEQPKEEESSQEDDTTPTPMKVEPSPRPDDTKDSFLIHFVETGYTHGGLVHVAGEEVVVNTESAPEFKMSEKDQEEKFGKVFWKRGSASKE